MIDVATLFEDPNFLRIVVAILVKRLNTPDGVVKIAQSDFDAIAYSRLLEGEDEDGELIMKIEERTKQ